VERYEYRIEQTQIEDLGKPGLAQRLNTLGAEGWQLVSTIAHERHGYSHEIHLLFSRRVVE